jgi:hypothetical protein
VIRAATVGAKDFLPLHQKKNSALNETPQGERFFTPTRQRANFDSLLPMQNMYL